MFVGGMDYVEAIDHRFSCRAFESGQLDQDLLDKLRVEVDSATIDSEGVRFVLHVPTLDGSSVSLSSRMFVGRPAAFVTCVGPNDPIAMEKIGYFGERIVLAATTFGLGSCWVAGTFDRNATTCDLRDDEAFHDVIPLGVPMANMPFKQRSVRKAMRAKSKRVSRLYSGPTSLESAPDWVQAGVEAAWKGPSAINSQPVVFAQEALGAPIRGTLPHVRRDIEYTDLGIAKFHFLLGASSCGASGTWEWGSGGVYALR